MKNGGKSGGKSGVKSGGKSGGKSCGKITCNIVIDLQIQLLDFKCNSITITIAELEIQLRNSITCISTTEQHW